MTIPIHPFLVHFPIAFIYGAVFFTGIQLWRPNWTCRIIGLWMVGISTITSILASISGQLELTKANQKNYDQEVFNILNKHEILGNFITWALLVLFITWLFFYFKYMDDKRFDQIVFIILLFLSIGVTMTAYLGGTLVWKHQVGF